MTRIPHTREVDRAFKSLKAEVQVVLRELNATASKAMAKGDYATAEALASKGREIQGFLTDVDALRNRWRSLRQGSKEGGSSSVTPLWAYDQPILRALSELGGAATRKELEPGVFNIMTQSQMPLDRGVGPGGRASWQTMITRARNHLVAEG